MNMKKLFSYLMSTSIIFLSFNCFKYSCRVCLIKCSRKNTYKCTRVVQLVRVSPTSRSRKQLRLVFLLVILSFNDQPALNLLSVLSFSR